MKFLTLIALTLALDLGADAWAQEVPEHFYPVRPYGMGGAFTAIANDENSIWTNPAGLARIRKARSRAGLHTLKLFNLIMGGNGQSQSYFSSVQSSAEDATSALSASAEENAEKPFWATASYFPVGIFEMGSMPGALGGFVHSRAKAVIDAENPDQTFTELISDTGGVFSMAFTTMSNRVNFGLQVRSISRSAFEGAIATADLANKEAILELIQSNSNKSTALAVDTGFMWTMADFWFPTIGFSILNAPIGCKDDYLNPYSKTRETVCGTVFSGTFANPDALSTVDPTDMRFGLSITPRLTRKLAMRLSVDLHHIHYAVGTQNYGLSDIPTQKTFHGGVELFLGNPLTPAPISFAVGMSQGFYTMGASVRLSFISLDFVTFGRDISNTEEPVEDRRTLFGFSLDI